MGERLPMFSDGPIAGFNGGWAIIPFPGGRAHHWSRLEIDVGLIGKRGRVTPWESLCGQTRVTHDGIVALGRGNFPQCKRCAKKLPTALSASGARDE